jgi:hypothetical protein
MTLSIGLLASIALTTALPPSVSWAGGPAFGYAPQLYKNQYTYGQGVYFAPFELKIYAQPSETASLVEHFRWGHGSNSRALVSQIRNAVVTVDKVFISYYPSLDVAMMAVLSENEDGWAEVVYDHDHQRTGWVKLRHSGEAPSPEDETWPLHFGRFQTWQDYMKLNAKANGIYWLNGVSQYDRMIRTAPEDGAKALELTVIKRLKVKHIRGNWMLVEVLDFENQTPLGWVRWRDEAGRLMVFTNLSGNRLPMLSSFY